MRVNRNKKISAIILSIAILMATALSGCSQSSSASTENETATPAAEITPAVEEAEEALETALDVMSVQNDISEYSAVITLNGETIEISGNGAASDGSEAVITDAGTYYITGTLNDGRLIVDAQGEDVVVILSGAAITCSYSSPLMIYKSASTTLVLEDGTCSTLTDSASYDYSCSYSSQDDGEPNACLYSKSDLMITGNGSLVVNAAYNNGITGKDTLQIVYATVDVSAVNNGITGKDCVIISGASVSVDCSGNGITSSNDSDSSLGYITLSGSDVTVSCGEDGIDAQTSLSIDGSTLSIVSSGASTASAKGLKAESILISSGEFSIETVDDAIHAQGDVNIFGGSFTLSSGDDGIHGDDSVTISGGDITVVESYEGIEGNIINITGGQISVTASDDGLNAAGGADQSGFGGGFGDSFSSSTASINISGGVTYINAGGDGVDSNGNLNVTGGEVYVSGPTNDGNGPIDYEGTGAISGGIVVAAGSSGMAMNFGSTSTQGSLLVNLSGNAGDTVTLSDSEGNALVTFTAQKNYECVLVSCPELTVGEAYTLTAGSSSTSITMTSLITGGSGMGGMMAWGGMGQGSGNQPGGGMAPGGQPGGGQSGGGQPGGGMGGSSSGNGPMKP